MSSNKRQLKYWMFAFVILGLLGIIEITTQGYVAETATQLYGKDAAELGLGLITALLLFDFGFNAAVIAGAKFILDLSLIYFVFAALIFKDLKRIEKKPIIEDVVVKRTRAKNELTGLFRTYLSNRKVLLSILGIGLIGLCFYWYELRPRNIESNCHDVAVKAAQKENQRKNPWEAETLFEREDYSLYYQMCTRSKGL